MLFRKLLSQAGRVMLNQAMQNMGAKCRVLCLTIVAASIAFTSLYRLLHPVSSGCIMTYMHPTYLPIRASEGGGPSSKYRLYMYHEGWKKIDFIEHLKLIKGVPVLFIPGNAGSFKQVRSLAAESDRAYSNGRLEHSFYQESFLSPEEREDGTTSSNPFQFPKKYSRMLDWFAVDLEGEHSAMDTRTLEEHTEYVVHAIHKILDQYEESYDAQKREGVRSSEGLPDSVILVGHSMGGFIARAATVHPHLRNLAVRTIVTLSSPHQSPPIALQPSLGNYFSQVNKQWARGYQNLSYVSQHRTSGPVLSHVVIVSISGGFNDYQVKTEIESLDGLVPPMNGFLISTTSMKKIWLSMEHQTILWCNQLVVQVAHTLLSLIDAETGHPFVKTQERLQVFAKMLRSSVSQAFQIMGTNLSVHRVIHANGKGNNTSVMRKNNFYGCPRYIKWKADAFERDLYIQSRIISILSMDGRRRWVDIQQVGSNDTYHFIFVANFSPCYGVKLHLWPKKGILDVEIPASRRVVEVSSRMVHIPSGPAPRQAEPGSQTQQASPSSIFWLKPDEMDDFRYLTISIVPQQSVSVSHHTETSMAVGQFFNPEEGQMMFSVWSILRSAFSENVIFVKEDHPLVYNLSFKISLGLLPVKLSLRSVGCGINNSEFPAEHVDDMDITSLCKFRCFPSPVLVSDATSGVHVLPNLYSETVTIDSSPGLWISNEKSEMTTVILLVDPHCSYRVAVAASFSAAASRFFLLYAHQIIAHCFAAVLFGLMQQARSWELNLHFPSLLASMEYNLKIPFPFMFLTLVPVSASFALYLLFSGRIPSVVSYAPVSIICYLLGNAFIVIIVLISQIAFYVTAVSEAFISTRYHCWERWIPYLLIKKLRSSIGKQVLGRIFKVNTVTVTAVTAITLACLVHPALSLLVLSTSHALSCHATLSRSLKRMENGRATQMEMFNHWHGLFILHLLALLMFVPSLVAWTLRLRSTGHGSLPVLLDSAICLGIIMHVATVKPPSSSPDDGRRWRISTVVYGLSGFYCFLCGLAMLPYLALYALAAIGLVSLHLSLLSNWNLNHSHRH